MSCIKVYRTIVAAVVLTALALPYAGEAKAQVDEAQEREVAVLVPPRTEGGIPPSMGERAMGVLARALRSDHFSVIEPSQAVAIAESVGAEAGGEAGQEYLAHCTTTECAAWYRSVLNASIALQLTLFTKVGPGANSGVVESVSLAIVQRGTGQFSGSAPVADGDVESAALDAYRAAREKQLKGVGPWLTVRGKPEGAHVRLDGSLWGALPHKDAVRPGIHAIIVSKRGYREESHSVTVGDRADAETLVEVDLTSTDGDLDTASEPSTRGTSWWRANHWDYLAGGGLMAVGAAHLVRYVVVRGENGRCAEREGTDCVEVYASSSKGGKALLGIGLAGVITGAAVIGVGPFGRLSAEVGSESAQLTLQGAF